ncbi:MAG: histidine phosphatase family protein [Pseudomonadota bacterium]
MMSVHTWPDLWILRHGETEWNAAGRLQGRLDSRLTRRGEAQARAQGRVLQQAGLPEGIEVRVSAAGRARRTADIALAGMDWPVTIDPDLVEVGLGDWQGLTQSDIRRTYPGFDLASDPHLWKFIGPGCETLPEIVARAHRVLKNLRGPSILVTHGVTSRILRCLVLGLPPERLSALPGGQGVVHYISEGRAQLLTSETEDPKDDQNDSAEGDNDA